MGESSQKSAAGVATSGPSSVILAVTGGAERIVGNLSAAAGAAKSSSIAAAVKWLPRMHGMTAQRIPAPAGDLISGRDYGGGAGGASIEVGDWDA